MGVEVIISADSHFVEPPEMWIERVDKQYRDRAPRVAKNLDGRSGWFLVCEDLEPTNGSGFFAGGVEREELAEFLEFGYEAAPDHIRDPAARIAAQDADGVSAEVMYASYGMSMFHIRDDGLREACFRAFNDWAAEYCSYDQHRLIGIGLIALDDVDAAVIELHRIADRGLRGAMIWAEAPEEMPYSDQRFDPFWSAAEDLDMKLSLHSLTSKRKNFRADPAGLIYRSIVLYQEIARTLTDFVINGVLERHPRLRVVSVENELGWLPFHLWRMDQLREMLQPVSPIVLTAEPSSYFHRQIFATFVDDPFFSSTVPAIGAKNLMWSSDFPHLQSSYPHSREVIAKHLGEISPEARQDIVRANVARLYDI
jgi:predicted TIM-barrel fold metal-dependent hydrolase